MRSRLSQVAHAGYAIRSLRPVCGVRVCGLGHRAVSQDRREGSPLNPISLGRRLKHTLAQRRPRSAKLDETLVSAIKADLAGGLSQRDAARKYHVARGTISSIATGLTWGSVAAAPTPCGMGLPTA